MSLQAGAESGSIYHIWYMPSGRMLYLVFMPVFLQRYLPWVRFPRGLARPSIPPEAFDRLLAFLGPREKASLGRFATLKKQVEWLCGRLAAKSAVQTATGTRLELSQLDLAYQREGAPLVRALPDLPLSISHSGAWAGAVAGGRGRIGLDIEAVASGGLQFLLAAGFSGRERAELAGAGPETVIGNWTCKEAYLKYIGRGLNESLAAVEIFGGRLYHHGRKVEGIGVVQESLGVGYVMSMVFRE